VLSFCLLYVLVTACVLFCRGFVLIAAAAVLVTADFAFEIEAECKRYSASLGLDAPFICSAFRVLQQHNQFKQILMTCVSVHKYPLWVLGLNLPLFVLPAIIRAGLALICEQC
jgi:hypothetical protein